MTRGPYVATWTASSYAALTVNATPSETGYDMNYTGSGFPQGADVHLFLEGLLGRKVPLAIGVATADKTGKFAGVNAFLCTNPAPSPDAVLQAQDKSSPYVIASTPVAFKCSP